MREVKVEGEINWKVKQYKLILFLLFLSLSVTEPLLAVVTEGKGNRVLEDYGSGQWVRNGWCETPGCQNCQMGPLIAVIITFYLLHDESVGRSPIRDEQPAF